MSKLDLIDAWIKAAVEHVTLKISYYSARTKGQASVREVEPDFFGTSRDGKNTGCWGFCRLRRQNRVFMIDSILGWEFVGNSFQPNPRGRWKELLPIYNSKKLDKINWK